MNRRQSLRCLSGIFGSLAASIFPGTAASANSPGVKLTKAKSDWASLLPPAMVGTDKKPFTLQPWDGAVGALLAQVLLQDAVLGADALGFADEDELDLDAHLARGVDLAEVGVGDAPGDPVALDLAQQRHAGLAVDVERDEKLGADVLAHGALEVVRVELEQGGLAAEGRQDGRDGAGAAQAARGGGAAGGAGFRFDFDFL